MQNTIETGVSSVRESIESALRDSIVSRSDSELDLSGKIKACRALKLIRAGQWRKAVNYALAGLSRRLGQERVFHMPFALGLDPTNACQLSCPFCISSKPHGSDYLPFEIYEAIIKRLGPWLIKVDFCTGAEPLLHPRICDMIALAKHYGIETAIASNINHVPDPAALVSSGLDLLMMSVDGITPETYGRYRVGGDFEKVMANMRALAAERRRLGRNRPSLVWNYLVFSYNEHEIPEVVRLAREIGVDFVTFMAPYIPQERRAELQSSIPRFLSPGSSQPSAYCLWPWSGLLIYPTNRVCLCYEDSLALSAADRLAEDFDGVWNGEYLRGARRALAARGAGSGTVEGHNCGVCRRKGEINFCI